MLIVANAAIVVSGILATYPPTISPLLTPILLNAAAVFATASYNSFHVYIFRTFSSPQKINAGALSCLLRKFSAKLSLASGKYRCSQNFSLPLDILLDPLSPMISPKSQTLSQNGSGLLTDHSHKSRNVFPLKPLFSFTCFINFVALLFAIRSSLGVHKGVFDIIPILHFSVCLVYIYFICYDYMHKLLILG